PAAPPTHRVSRPTTSTGSVSPPRSRNTPCATCSSSTSPTHNTRAICASTADKRRLRRRPAQQEVQRAVAAVARLGGGDRQQVPPQLRLVEPSRHGVAQDAAA